MLHLVTAPQREPLELDDLRKHLKIDDTVEDELLRRLQTAVRLRGERATRRAFITQTLDQYRPLWPVDGTRVELLKPPLQSVSFVKYTDQAGALQTWATTEYDVDVPSGPYCARGSVNLGYQKTWPIVRGTVNSIQMRTVCGYGDTPDDVPELLRQAMLLDAGTLYGFRSSVLSGTIVARVPDTAEEIYRTFRSL